MTRASAAGKPLFFYGWVIVLIGFMTTFMSNGTAFWGLQVFVVPIHDDTGWSRASIMGALSLRWIVAAAGGLFLGHLADRRRGPMFLLLAGTLIDGISMICLRWVDSPWQFLFLFGFLGGIGSVGTGRLLAAALVPKWFVVKRGFAMGMASMGSGVSALLMAPFVNLLVDEFGWRDGWTILGLITIVGLLPLVPFARQTPEEMGLQPDNGVVATSATARRLTAEAKSLTVREARATPQLWLLIIAMSIGLFSQSTNASSMVPYFKDAGFSAGVAASALSVYGVFSSLSRFVWGWVADRLTIRQSLVIQAVTMSLGIVFILQVNSLTTMYLAAAYQGLALGGFVVLQPLIWPEFFGRRYLGAITGFTQFFTTFALAFGPLFAGAMFDAIGSYATAYKLLIVTWLLCAGLTFAIRPIKEEPAATSTLAEVRS